VSSTSDLKVGFIGKIDVVEDHSIGFQGGRKGRKKACLFKELLWSHLRVFKVDIKSQLKEGNGQ